MSEFELLLRCARTRPESERIRKLVQSGVDGKTDSTTPVNISPIELIVADNQAAEAA